jgi:hypothetical protein
MWGTRPKRALLVATLSAVALLAAGTSVSAAEPGSITIKKVCPPGFGGLAQIEVSKVLGVGVETGAAGFNIECGSSLRVSSIPGDGGTPPIPLFVGDRVHVVEVRSPTGLAGLANRVVTLTGQNTLEVDNEAALSLHKICAAGVTGSATFVATAHPEGPTESVMAVVACGATVPLHLTDTFMLVRTTVYESIAPLHGTTAPDQTVTPNFATPQTLTFADRAVTGTTTLAHTGGAGSANGGLFLLAGAAALLLGLAALRRRRPA